MKENQTSANTAARREKIIVREMCPEDLEQVAKLEKHIFSEPWSREGFAVSLASKDTLYFVAVLEKNVVGYCGLLRSFEEADITNVAVDTFCRNQGIARKMLTVLMREGKNQGIDRFTLEVRKSNQAAIHLYETLGFVSVGVRKNFYSRPTEDAVIMWTK